MRKLIIIASCLSLLLLTGVGFLFFAGSPPAPVHPEKSALGPLREGPPEDVDVAVPPMGGLPPPVKSDWVVPPLGSEGPKSEQKKRGTTGSAPVAANTQSEQKKMEETGKVLEQLPKGKIVLDAPKTMKVSDVRAVHANVGINVPIQDLQRYSARPGTQSTEATLRVSSEMLAKLTGPAFTITATTPEQQGVAEGFPTVWSWNIEAKEEGEQELEATLYVLIPSGDKSTQQRIDSYSHKIGVSVKEQSWADWLKSSKEAVEAMHVIAVTLGSTAMLVVGWLGWAYSRRRRTKENHDAADRPTAVT